MDTNLKTEKCRFYTIAFFRYKKELHMHNLVFRRSQTRNGLSVILFYITLKI